MECTRCRGMLVPDYSFDHLDATSSGQVRTWRCVMCGDVVDPVILHNRRQQVAHMAATAGTVGSLIKSAA